MADEAAAADSSRSIHQRNPGKNRKIRSTGGEGEGEAADAEVREGNGDGQRLDFETERHKRQCSEEDETTGEDDDG